MPRHHLLLVDDSPEIAFIVKRFGKQADQEVTSCRTVDEAWDWLGNGSTNASPDLILLDMHLPGPSGLELCKRLRSDATGKTTPIALLSDWRRQDEIAVALDAGADYVLEKDLLCHPNKWQNRLAEILLDVQHRRFGSIIRLHEQCLLTDSPEQALAALDGALKRLATSLLGPHVLGVLFKKALAHSLSDSEWNDVKPNLRPEADSLNFIWEMLSPGVRLARAKSCWVELAHLVWCAVGSDSPKLLDEALKCPVQA